MYNLSIHRNPQRGNNMFPILCEKERFLAMQNILPGNCIENRKSQLNQNIFLFKI